MPSTPLKEMETAGTVAEYGKSDIKSSQDNESSPISPVKAGPKGCDNTRDPSYAGDHGVNNSCDKNNSKRQNPLVKSPRLARKMTSGFKNSNVPVVPKKFSTSSSSSSSSLEANSPKRNKPNQGRYYASSVLDPEHFDRFKFTNRYKISESGEFSKVSSLANTAVCKMDRVDGTGLPTTWKDISPTESKTENAPGTLSERRSRPESGYFSNDVHSESREGMDGSVSEESDHAGTIKLRPKKKPNPETAEDGGCGKMPVGSVQKEMPSCQNEEQSDTVIGPIESDNRDHVYKNGPGKVPKSSRNLYPYLKSAVPKPTDVESTDTHSKLKPGDEVSEVAEKDFSKSSTKDGALIRKESIRAKGVSANPRQVCTDWPVKKLPNLIASLENSDGLDPIEEKPASQDDGSSHGYFFDEDLIVQYDGNLHTSVGVILQGSCAFSLADSLVPGKKLIHK